MTTVTKIDEPRYGVALRPGDKLVPLTEDEALDLIAALAAALGVEPQLPTVADVVSPTQFNYDGITRQGYVIGLSPGRLGGVNVDVIETWNDRDGWHVEPKFKCFTGAHITNPRRLQSA